MKYGDYLLLSLKIFACLWSNSQAIWIILDITESFKFFLEFVSGTQNCGDPLHGQHQPSLIGDFLERVLVGGIRGGQWVGGWGCSGGQ